MKKAELRAGVDVGSTTAKLIIIDASNDVVFSLYRRHGADTVNTLRALLMEAEKSLGDISCTLTATGSAAMGIAERCDFNFIQEVIAAGELTKKCFPDVHTLIDIGGEDSKMMFLADGRVPDIRMNGSCAGGTGAFIDQMASLLGITALELNELALDYEQLHPIASRCGVFAKTDVQNLVSRKLELPDICASILNAVCVQAINSLARGVDIVPKVLFCGGPLKFIPALRNLFIKNLQLTDEDVIYPEYAEFLPAWGAALVNIADERSQPLSEWSRTLSEMRCLKDDKKNSNRLPPLFDTPEAFANWERERKILEIPRVSYNEVGGNSGNKKPLFLGIDSGSTTTKVILIDDEDRIVFEDYSTNKGRPVKAVAAALNKLKKVTTGELTITATAVTGYGEDLIRAAFDLDYSAVETIAHWRAAKHCAKDVSFILDVGGQDMKAIFVQDGGIRRIEINEACSSGCGSFIEGFAQSLGTDVKSFALSACRSTAPCDLGTRCTVFMNSRIKQAQREDSSLSDIAAGLAYSVIKNTLYKVLKLRDSKELGDEIVVQGGTFRNPAVFRAIELLAGVSVSSSNIPELMGAFGAAILAKEALRDGVFEKCEVTLESLSSRHEGSTKKIQCSACTNQCVVTRFDFGGARKYFIGNKCERVFSSKGKKVERGENLFAGKNALLFERPVINKALRPKVKIGIPRILGMFEEYPFWCTLLRESGFEVVLSSPSSNELAELGNGTVMSDNICFPAKLAHGHVADLLQKKVDRIFYPHVLHQRLNDPAAHNSYNCPIVTGYSEVLTGAMGFDVSGSIPFDAPKVTFLSEVLLRKSCKKYLATLGVTSKRFRIAFDAAMTEYNSYHKKLITTGTKRLEDARAAGRPLIVLAARPYHIDPLIEHETSHILSELGADVLPVDLAAELSTGSIRDLVAVSQWAFPNRLFKAAQWVATQAESNIQLVMLNSFGCGPDAFIMDEIRDLLAQAGKIFTLIKVDDIASTGSVRLRLRSLIETIAFDAPRTALKRERAKTTVSYQKSDRGKPILAPYFADCYSPFFAPIFKLLGYDLHLLPPPDRESVEYGLRYANNEICYPATLIIGDMIRAFKTGGYDPDKTAVGMTQTGGQCRASNYVALIRKALVAAGYPQVPVIAAAEGGGEFNDQPGFAFDLKAVIKPSFTSILYADAIAHMYYRSAVREKSKGAAKALRDKYVKQGAKLCAENDPKEFLRLLHEAVVEFNSIIAHHNPVARVGLVGEIYLKFNSFSQLDITEWFISQGIEVIVPSLLDFLLQYFVNIKVNRELGLKQDGMFQLRESLLRFLASRWMRRFEDVLKGFHCYEHVPDVYEKAELASGLISLAHQYGEGWLIPAEILTFAQHGIYDVVCLQPFGCIANHVVAKGIEKKIKRKHPEINLLFVDFDAGTSEVNTLNRLHFMASNARNRLELIGV